MDVDQPYIAEHFCGLCRKNVNSVVDCNAVSDLYNIPLSSMFDIFQVPNNSTTPSSICDQCADQLRTAYDFYQKVLQSINLFSENFDLSTNSSVIAKFSPQKARFPCDNCDMKFENDLALKRHKKLSHAKISIQNYCCEHCNKQFITNRGLVQHSIYCNKNVIQTYHCDQCFRNFTTRTNYINHISHHVDFLCNFCDHGFLDKKKLLEHVKDNHADRLFRCKYCSRTESLRKTLNRHLRMIHNIQRIALYCGHCMNESAFDDIALLNVHIEEVHNNSDVSNEEYTEIFAEPFFAKDLTLDLELEKSRQEEYKEVFLKQFNLVRSKHFEVLKSNTVNPNKMILEEFLDEAFENDQIWAKYIEGGEEYLIDNYDFYLEGPTTAKSVFNYKCPKCEAEFMKQALLIIHLAETHSVSCLVCNDCGANFQKVIDFRNHRREHLKDNARFVENIIPEAEEALSLVQQEDKEYTVFERDTTYVFSCKLCDRTFLKKCNLEKHKCSFYAGQSSANQKRTTTMNSNSTSGGDPTLPDSLFCTLCDKKFTSISGLKYHLKRHTDIKAFACVYCNKKFTANSNLNAHIRNKHSEIKSHVCSECDQAFACKDHLSKHIRSRHRLERAFKCSECSKSYFQKSHLNDHVAASHMEYKAFVCDLCNTSYSCRGSLRRHLAKRHRTQ